MSANVYDAKLRPDVAPEQSAAPDGPTRALVQAELFTDGFHIIGSLELHRAGARLVDFLNFGGEPVLLLHDVQVRALGREWDKLHHWPTAHLRREAIILAIPHEDRLPPAEPERMLEYVVKEPRRVCLVGPSLAVVGNLHLAKEVDINIASPIRGSDFLPLTDAEATYLPQPTLVWKAPVIIVNVAKVELCYPNAGSCL
ncbi:MAG: hypothetical protein ACUVV3_06130 [Dehalococcoidia bacterium]